MWKYDIGNTVQIIRTPKRKSAEKHLGEVTTVTDHVTGFFDETFYYRLECDNNYHIWEEDMITAAGSIETVKQTEFSQLLQEGL